MFILANNNIGGIMYIALFLIGIFTITILIPVRIVVDYEYYSKDYNVNNEELKKEIKIYILKFVRIKKLIKKNDEKNLNNKILFNLKNIIEKIIELKKEEKLVERSELKKLKQCIYLKKLDLDIGLNTKKVILNAYIISLLNTTFNMFLAKNCNRINLNKVQYNTYLSNNLLRIKLKSIIEVKLANNTIVILKFIIKVLKGGRKNGKETTSNRKSNVNSYDFSRKYG